MNPMMPSDMILIVCNSIIKMSCMTEMGPSLFKTFVEDNNPFRFIDFDLNKILEDNIKELTTS